jgi:hypothetical protein
LNPLEIKLNNDEDLKKKIQVGYKTIANHKKQYALQIVSQYDLTLGVVSHIVDYDIKNEFDPLMLERMKNCMK